MIDITRVHLIGKPPDGSKATGRIVARATANLNVQAKAQSSKAKTGELIVGEKRAA